jgi:hypothetical protein
MAQRQTELEQVDARELAKQLTLLLAKDFARLRPKEYAYFLRTKVGLFDLIYNHKLNDAEINRKMGHLTRIIARFCGLVHWLRREIVEAGYGPRRSKTLGYMFHLARVRCCETICCLTSLTTLCSRQLTFALHRSCFKCATCML